MRVLIISEYFPPEDVGAGIWVHQLALDLKAAGHTVAVLTAFPNYPRGAIFPGYRGKLLQRETIGGIDVYRTWIHATRRRGFWPRALSFGSFCASALVRGLSLPGRFDAVYAILPPLPLGVAAAAIARLKRAALVVNVQDLYPYLAVVSGYLRNRAAIRFFEAMERWIYRRADRVVVISQGFREHVVAQGTGPEKLAVIPNWADPDQIRPGPKQNRFRAEIGGLDAFTVIYSGGIGHNATLQPLLEAAGRLRSEPFRFVIAGEGAQKQALVERARAASLANVVFRPFQPLERYGEVLAAADANVVTLASTATFASVPSKVYKLMAAARPIFALAEGGNELARLIEDAGCGFCISPQQPDALVEKLRYAAAHPETMREMGERGRRYLEQNCSRAKLTAQIAEVLESAVGAGERLALPLGYAAKVALEWLAALLALIVLSPLLALVALAVALDSPGPVLYRQPRLGRGGRVFTIYKFRTLRWAPLASPRLAADGSTVVEVKDDRLTRTGRWLRGGLDELPQLWNVLRGEMTLIGPRPDEPFHARHYTAEERRKLLVPPGITGLPQVAGRTDIPWKERIRMDLDYIDHYSPARDVWIAARTLALLVRPPGAGRAE